MTEPRLMLDEMLSGKIAEALRAEAVDAVAVVDIPGLPGTADDALLALAAQEQRIVVTKNLIDFIPLAQHWAVTGRTHQGLILISTKTFPETRSSLRAITAALLDTCRSGRVPAPGQQAWLQ